MEYEEMKYSGEAKLSRYSSDDIIIHVEHGCHFIFTDVTVRTVHNFTVNSSYPSCV